MLKLSYAKTCTGFPKTRHDGALALTEDAFVLEHDLQLCMLKGNCNTNNAMRLLL